MSNAVFPTLPGLKWDVKKTPIWHTRIQAAASGKELRAALMSYPLWKFSLAYEVLRADVAYSELQTLMGFFNARNGSFDDFLYTDPDDNSVTDQQFGIGNGTATAFQLTRPYGGFAEPIQNVNVLTNIKKGGVVQNNPTDYTISSTGVVTFTVAPANGAVLTWSGTYYFRVRFLQDMAEFNQFMYRLWELQQLEFQSVKL
jgi:uncharacterized protein (TIGR02217 family)